MRRALLAMLMFSLFVGASSQANAGPISAWNSFWASIARDTYRNNCWPKPFVYADRASVKAPFVTMVQNGWKLQNLMGDYHFNQETHKLTTAGEMKVRWILTQAPVERRTIFVQTGMKNSISSARMDSVQQVATSILPNGVLPAVQKTNLSPKGWSAAQIDSVYRGYIKSMPAPRIPEAVRSTQEE